MDGPLSRPGTARRQQGDGGIRRQCWSAIGLTLWVFLLSLPTLLQATQFDGEVVSVSDGDTIRVVYHGRAAAVRLHGVDAPEKRQAFGTTAQQFTTSLAFGHTVTVIVHTTDRYGRLVGEVLLPDGRNLNQELVRAGLAWWYRQYAPKAITLQHLEAEARAARRGLWHDPQAIPPWDWRRQQHTRLPVDTNGNATGLIVGNRQNRIYHWPGCPLYDQISPANREVFESRQAAEVAGYQAAPHCQ